MTQRRHLLARSLLFAPALLAACGFRLRGSPSFAFRSVHLQAAQDSPMAAALHAQLEQAGLRVQRAAGQAVDVQLEILEEARERVVVGSNAQGQVRELQLRLRLRYTLRTPGGAQPLIETAELRQQRDVTYNESSALAKEGEEALLLEGMREDLARQLLRQLAAVRSLE